MQSVADGVSPWMPTHESWACGACCSMQFLVAEAFSVAWPKPTRDYVAALPKVGYTRRSVFVASRRIQASSHPCGLSKKESNVTISLQ